MAPIIYIFKTMPTPDASQYTRFKRYEAISNHAVGSVGSKISPFNTSYTLPILSASSNLLFLPSANKEKKFPPPPLPPLPPQNFVLDLQADVGIRFEDDGGGDSVVGEYTFSSTRTVNVIFINVPASISVVGASGGYGFLSFWTDPGMFTINDVVTIINPTQTPDISYREAPPFSIIDVTGIFSLTASSVITLTTINPITTLRIDVG